MTTIDLSPVIGHPWQTVREYVTQLLELSDRLDSASDHYAMGYLSRATRMDLGKICKKGDPCGNSCIPSTKQCSPDKKALTTKASIELSARAKGADNRFAKAAAEGSDRPKRSSKVTHLVSDFEQAKERRAAKIEDEKPKPIDMESARIKREASKAIADFRNLVESDPELGRVLREFADENSATPGWKPRVLEGPGDTPFSKDAKALLESMKATDESLAELTKVKERIQKKYATKSKKGTAMVSAESPESGDKELGELTKKLVESMTKTDKSLAEMKAVQKKVKAYNKRSKRRSDSFWRGYYKRAAEFANDF